MKGFRLLLIRELIPAAEAVCAALGVPGEVVSEQASWDRPEHCLFQIDLPGLQARVLEEAARLRRESPETLLGALIARSRTETNESGPEGPPDGVLRRCRLLAQWEQLGYTGTEPAVSDLARRFARE